MKRLIIFGAICAITVGRPELYKEKEDFQFSRSSSDDGSKSGYYGAQRGNMGGNYERAHNMDTLAQNQMSGLVRQVEGELGDGAKTRSGSVYTAANSRGTYGSGHFDLSNLAGRNFQEGTSYDDSHSRSSLSTSAFNSAGYANSRSQSSRHSAYQTAGHSGLNLQSDDLQSLDNTQGLGQYDYGKRSTHSAGYHSQSGFQEHRAYDLSDTNSNSNDYGSNINTRLVSATPVRIIVRPGTRVAIPVAAHTYDATRASSSVDQNSLNSETEILNNDNQRAVYRPSNAKHYESSYNYRKEWEKHDTIPSSIPLAAPTEYSPKNSELYEDSKLRTSNGHYDASKADSLRVHSSNIYSGYNANVKSASSQLRSNYDAQLHGASADSSSNAYTLAGYNAGSNQQATSSDSTLNIQAQHSSGSRYHGTADANSFTRAADLNGDLNSQVEDINAKPKSYHSAYSYHKSWERQGDPYVIKPASGAYYDAQSSIKSQGYAAAGSHYQQAHQSSADCDENGHIRVARSYNSDQYQQQSQNIEDLGQQVEDLGQQVEDLGQQTLSNWDQQETGQQVQNSWDNLEDLSQQSQNKWDRIEDLGQQTQNNWDQQETGQHVQNTWDNLKDLSQQSQNKWDRIEDLGQQKTSDLGQSTVTNWDQKDFEQQNQDTNEKVYSPEQQTQNDMGQRTQDNKVIELGNKTEDIGSQTEDQLDLNKNQEKEKDFAQNQDYHNENKIINNNKPSKIFHQMNIWNKFDNHQSENQNVQHNKSNDNVNFLGGHSNTHQVSQNGGLNDQSHSSWKNVDVTPILESSSENAGAKHFWEQFSDNEQQIYKTPETYQQSNPGYFNFQSYNHQNQFEKHEHSYQETHKQEQAINTFGSIPLNKDPLSSLWNKLDTIEQQSLNDMVNENNQNENEFMEVNQSSQTSYHSSREKQANHTENTLIQKHSQVKPYNEYEYQPIQPQVDKDIQSASSNQKERSQDIGRGDIDPEDLSDAVIENKPFTNPFRTTISGESTQRSNQNNKIEKDLSISSSSELSVLNLDQQKIQDLNNQNKDNIGININNTNIQNYSPINKHSVGLHGPYNPSTLNGGQAVNQSHSNQVSNLQDTNQQNLQNFVQSNLQDFDANENLEQQNLQSFGQQNLEDFGQQNLQDFGNHDFGQQNLEVFDQQNLQNFRQQDFGPRNLEDIGQQNLEDFGQQNLQQDFDHQNLQAFKQHEHLEQQNLQDFSQQNYEHEHLEQQNLQNFGSHINKEQHNLQVTEQQKTLGQQIIPEFAILENLEQKSLQNFDQQNEQHYSQHENLDQQNLQDFGKLYYHEQHNLQPSRQEKALVKHENRYFEPPTNVEQQKLDNLDQLNQETEQTFKYSDKLEKEPRHQNNNLHPQINFAHPEVEEPIHTQKQNNNLQIISSSEILSPMEPVTEKPGFWKSVGNKFSTAKSKITSWFKS